MMQSMKICWVTLKFLWSKIMNVNTWKEHYNMQMNKAILRNSEIVIFVKKKRLCGCLGEFFFTSDLSLFICMDKRFDWWTFVEYKDTQGWNFSYICNYVWHHLSQIHIPLWKLNKKLLIFLYTMPFSIKFRKCHKNRDEVLASDPF